MNFNLNTYIDRIITKVVHIVWTFKSVEHGICLVRPDRD